MKVPAPRKLPSGTWFIQLRLGGESVPVSANTARECTQKAQLLKAQHRAGQKATAPKTDKTLRQIIQYYIDALPSDTSPSTIRGYYSICNNRFPSVIDQPFSSVSAWQQVIDAEAQHIAPKTLKNSWGLVDSALGLAGIPTPKIKLPAVVSKPRPFLEPEDVLKLVDLVRGDRYEIPILLALHGLRRSEILAMTFGKIDLTAGTIRVHGAAVLNADGDLVQKESNKNVSSHRTIPIMIPSLVDAIQAVPARKPDDLVFTGNLNTIYKHANLICRKNGLPEVGVHGLRHSFASLAYHLKLSERETMELGGWSDPGTLSKIYTHLAQVDRLKGQNKIKAFFSGDPAPAR